MHSGASIGIAPLQLPAAAVGGGAPAVAGQLQVAFTRIRSVKGVRDGGSPGISSLALLPCCRVVVVGCEDGSVMVAGQ